MTVDEYHAAPWRIRVGYRIFRHPLVLFVLSPAVLFLLSHRFARNGAGPREIRSVLLTDLGLLVIGVISYLTIGLPIYLMIQIPLMAITASIGVWMFYVQHQYEGVYWARHTEWDPVRAALEGSSYYQLPGLLEWFTGSIGYHYLHHLRPRIPNYRLRQCSRELPVVPESKPLTLRGSLKCMFLHLWCETEQKLVGFPKRRAHKPMSS